jgi:hypothetical protein
MLIHLVMKSSYESYESVPRFREEAARWGKCEYVFPSPKRIEEEERKMKRERAEQ